MRNYQEQDIRFYDLQNNIEGDFMVDETGDFALTGEYESARQDLTNRARTQKQEWRSHQNLGADIELLEGEPNTRQTANRGVEQLYEAMTYDGRFDGVDLDIRGVPTSIESLDFYMILNTDTNGNVVVVQPIDL